MRIAVDARELDGQPTGVGRYLAEILGAWRTLPEAANHEMILCRPDAPPSGTLWEQLMLPRQLRRRRADVLFAPAYTGPVRCPVPMVLTVHDVSFAAHPEWFSLREGIRRRWLTRLSAQRAGRIITVSDFSKSEIVRHLGVAADKVDVIYSGLNTLRREVPASTPAPPRSAAVLYVGSVFNRRHVPELIAGFGALARRHPEVQLDIVGDNRTTPRVDLEAVARGSGAAERVRLRSYISDDELAGLYATAGVFAFLSDYEGFGFTPLEALAARVPIVVLDTSVAREIYGAAAFYVPKAEPALVDAALERALFDAPERARVLGAAHDVLARYSWRESARRTLQTIVAQGR